MRHAAYGAPGRSKVQPQHRLFVLQGHHLADWVAQLYSDEPIEQLQAAAALNRYLQQSNSTNRNYRHVIQAGAISGFAAILQGSSRETAVAAGAAGSSAGAGAAAVAVSLQCAAVQALDALVHHEPSCCLEVVSAEAVPALVSLLWSADQQTQWAASGALDALAAADADCKAAVVQAGAIAPAVGMLSACAVAPAIQAAAAGIICNIYQGNSSISKACRAEALEAGAIPAVVAALRSTCASAQLQVNAAAFLQIMVNTEPGAAAALRESGAVGELLRLLSSSDRKAREHAVSALHVLAETDAANQACICEARNGLKAVVGCLRTNSSSVLASTTASSSGYPKLVYEALGTCRLVCMATLNVQLQQAAQELSLL